MPETAKEPAMALDGGADGLDFYRLLVRQYKDVVRPGGWLVLEIGYAQAEDCAGDGHALPVGRTGILPPGCRRQ